MLQLIPHPQCRKGKLQANTQSEEPARVLKSKFFNPWVGLCVCGVALCLQGQTSGWARVPSLAFLDSSSLASPPPRCLEVTITTPGWVACVISPVFGLCVVLKGPRTQSHCCEGCSSHCVADAWVLLELFVVRDLGSLDRSHLPMWKQCYEQAMTVADTATRALLEHVLDGLSFMHWEEGHDVHTSRTCLVASGGDVYNYIALRFIDPSTFQETQSL